jgi:hypothetical protein
MIEHELEQYSDDWYRARIGLPTASQFHNIITPTGVPTRGDKRKNYMFRLIAERLLQQSMDDFAGNYWMKRGKQLEEEATAAFMTGFGRGWQVEKIGFCTTNDGKVGCSPDRVLRHGKNREGVEIKCPSPWVQVEYLLTSEKDTSLNFKPQVQGHMLICDFKIMHLFSYHPRMPPVHVRVLRDEDYIERLAKELFFFCNETDVEYERAKRIGPYKLAELLRMSAEMKDDMSFTGMFQ